MPRCPRSPDRPRPVLLCWSGTGHKHRMSSRLILSYGALAAFACNAVSAVCERSSGLIGCPISRSRTASCVRLELRSLPSPAVPCCVGFPCVHAVATTPAQRLGVLLRTPPYQPSRITLSGRPARRPFRGLLGVHLRYGLHTRGVTVYDDMLSEGFSHFVHLHDCSGCFRLERLPGGICTHWKAPPFHGARAKQARRAWASGSRWS
jgi:hypothetical protein